MTAFMVVRVAIKDPVKFQEYDEKSTPVLAQYGGERVIMGKADEALAGKLDHEAVGVAKFASKEALHAWHTSSDYQQLIPLRDEACDMTLITYSSMDVVV